MMLRQLTSLYLKIFIIYNNPWEKDLLPTQVFQSKIKDMLLISIFFLVRRTCLTHLFPHFIHVSFNTLFGLLTAIPAAWTKSQLHYYYFSDGSYQAMKHIVIILWKELIIKICRCDHGSVTDLKKEKENDLGTIWLRDCVNAFVCKEMFTFCISDL